ncbi:hypothetical protein F5Y19DRAFT_487408 [Xylariaceae sp. FL1651]|nr:hypothetical protein F5Y19DRAFT_487408 [Xylariaceae sp. FL1651]
MGMDERRKGCTIEVPRPKSTLDWRQRPNTCSNNEKSYQNLTLYPHPRKKLLGAILSSISLEKLPTVEPLPWILHFNFVDPVYEDSAGTGIMRASLRAVLSGRTARVSMPTHVCYAVDLILTSHRMPLSSGDNVKTSMNEDSPQVYCWLHEMEIRPGVSFGEAIDIILGYRLHHFAAVRFVGSKDSIMHGEDLFIQMLFLLHGWNILEPVSNERMRSIYQNVRQSSIDSRQVSVLSDQMSAERRRMANCGLWDVKFQRKDYNPGRDTRNFPFLKLNKNDYSEGGQRYSYVSA